MHQIIDHTIMHYIILSYFSFLSTLSFLRHNSLLFVCCELSFASHNNCSVFQKLFHQLLNFIMI